MFKLGFELGLYAMKRFIKWRLKEGVQLEDIYIEIIDMDVKEKAIKFYNDYTEKYR